MDEVTEEKIKSSNSIKQLYFRELREELLKLEKDRRKILILMIYIFAIIAGGTFTIHKVTNLYHNYGISFGIAILLGGYLLLRLIPAFMKAKSLYSLNYKCKIINKIVKFVEENLNYYPDRMISEKIFQESRIFTHRIDRYRGEDFVNWSRLKTDISFSKVHAEYKTIVRFQGIIKHIRWHQIFKGIFLTADFNKKFESFTVIKPGNAERIFAHALKSKNKIFPEVEPVKMYNKEFEKYFAVFSENQTEARDILIPEIMEKLVKFRKAVNRGIYISFNCSKVYIGVPFIENLFEPTLFKNIIDFAPIERYHKIIELIVGLVEELDLNTRI